jgi:phenylpyruvate tautomerase PptA (4-oxalocrotonate tautomerase family)
MEGLFMPCIETKVNVKISESQEKSLKEELGKAIAILPGKSESFLMLTVKDGYHMYFKGKNDMPIAFVEVKIFGKASDSDFEKLTAKICEIFKSILSIDPSNVYVKYEEVSHWGWNSSNF